MEKIQFTDPDIRILEMKRLKIGCSILNQMEIFNM